MAPLADEAFASTRGARIAEGAADRASGRALERPQAESIDDERATLTLDSDLLSEGERRRAARRNPRLQQRLGWEPGVFSAEPVDSDEFALEVARLQEREGLRVDGIVGPRTCEAAGGALRPRGAASARTAATETAETDELEATRGVRIAEGAADRAYGRALERPQAESIDDERATLDLDDRPDLAVAADARDRAGPVVQRQLRPAPPLASPSRGPTLKEVVQRRAVAGATGLLMPPSSAAPGPLWRRLDLGAPVQARTVDVAAERSDEQVHAAAEAGTATPAQALPYRAELEAATGRDLSSVRAHVGGDAAASADAMGAEAYARGDDVVLPERPSLHTVAHEVTHVLQQQGGDVQLKGGVGALGDRYEVEADAVADAIVRGESVADRLPSGGRGGAAVQRAPRAGAATGLTPDQFEATMDRRVHQATRAGQNLSAPAYLHANMDQVRLGLGDFLLSRSLGSGNPQVTFVGGRQAFLYELSKPFFGEDESSLVRLLQRWLLPVDLFALCDRNRPIFDADQTFEDVFERVGALARDRDQLRYDRGPKGPATWSPPVATAIGSELEARLAASAERVAARLVAETQKKRDAAAQRGDGAPAERVVADELAPSHPLDRAVAVAFLPVDGAEPTVEVAAGSLAVDPTAQLTYRKVRQVAWQGAAGGPWNALRAVDPADASVEEMARYLWSSRAEAYRLKKVGALFLLSPEDAAERPEAAAHRPAIGPGSRFGAARDDAYELSIGPAAAEAVDVEARAAGASVAGDAAAAPAAAAVTGTADLLAQWRGIHEQLTGLAIVTQPFGVADPILLADVQHSTRAADLGALTAESAATRAVVFREQRTILGEVAIEIGNLTTQFEAQRVQAAQAPDGARQAVSDGQLSVLRAFVRAAAMSHLAQTGRAALGEARQLQQTAVLAALEGMLSDAITRVELSRQLRSETLVYEKQSEKVFGAGFHYRQAELRTQIADLRTQLRQGHVDGQGIARLYGAIDAFRFETSLVAHLGTIRQAVHAVEALEESDWVAAAGQIDDLEAMRGAGHDLKFEIRAIHNDWLKIQQRAAALQAQIESSGGAPDADARAAAFAQAELATLKARLDKLGGDQRIQDYLKKAYAEIDDAQTKAAILQICVLIGVAVAAAATGGAAQGAVAGLIGEGGGAILAGMLVESATMSALNAALTGDSFVEAMTSDLAGNLVTLGALRALDSLMAGTRVGRALRAGADDAGRLAYYSAKGVELTARVVVIAGVQYAQMQVESLARDGRTLSMDEVREQGVKGVAMMIGTGVLTRLAKAPLARIKALGARGGGLVRQHIEVQRLAAHVEKTGDPAGALELLRAERAHLEAEAAMWNELAGKTPAELGRMGLEPEMVAALADNARGHLAGLDDMAGGVLPAQLGLDPVVPGRVFAGEPAAVSRVLDSYRERGYVVQAPPEGGRHVVTSPDGTTTLTVLERGAQRESATDAPDNLDAEPSRTPAAGERTAQDDRSPFEPERARENAQRERTGDIGYNAVVGYVRTEREGVALLQRLSRGDVAALQDLGTNPPPGFQPHGREWGLGRQWDGRYVIVAGEPAAVHWDALAGVEPVGHSHPIDSQRVDRQEGFRYDFDELVDDFSRLGTDTHLVFPSGADIQFLVHRRLSRHVVAVPYELVGDRHVQLTTPGSPAGAPVVFEISAGKVHGAATGALPGTVYSATLTALAGDRTVWASEVYAVIPPEGGPGRLSFERPQVVPATVVAGNAGRVQSGAAGDDQASASPKGSEASGETFDRSDAEVRNGETQVDLPRDVVPLSAARVDKRTLRSLLVIQEMAQAGRFRKASNFHAHFSDTRVAEILMAPDAIYLSAGGQGKLVFRQGTDVVIVAGPGSSQGNVITGYGPSGVKGPSGARALGGDPTDAGEPITHEQITNGTIPVAAGNNPLPPASQVWP